MIESLFGKLSRTKMIQSVGFIGVVANLLFAAIKMAIGIIANSVSITSDAANNLSDALSSVITLVGLKLSQKQPDRKHPLGYGRIEYLSSLIIAAIILFAGIEFFQTSFGRILHPEAINFTVVQFVILFITLVGKFTLSRLDTSVGKLVDSAALQGSGAEAMTDVFATAATLVTIAVAYFTGLNIDGYVGLLVSGLIIYAAIDQFRGTINDILGERADKELVAGVRYDLEQYEQILGAYDFIIHNYGPTTRVGTANLEFADTLSVKDAYMATHAAQKEILAKYQVYFTFGLYSVNTYDKAVSEMYSKIKETLSGNPQYLGMHAFRVDRDDKTIWFDVVVDFSTADFKTVREDIKTSVGKIYPGYSLELTVDLDYA